MTKYNLKFYLTPTLSGNKPKQIIILCHGYGGDGKDIGTLATNWRRFLPDAVFVSPDAPFDFEGMRDRGTKSFTQS